MSEATSAPVDRPLTVGVDNVVGLGQGIRNCLCGKTPRVVTLHIVRGVQLRNIRQPGLITELECKINFVTPHSIIHPKPDSYS